MDCHQIWSSDFHTYICAPLLQTIMHTYAPTHATHAYVYTQDTIEVEGFILNEFVWLFLDLMPSHVLFQVGCSALWPTQ